jgi:hypothetical protein
MARLTSTNYTVNNFPYATAPNDAFVKDDVQVLALAVENHTHETGKGLKVSGQAITAPLDLPGAFRTTAGAPLFDAGAGLEIYYETAGGGRGVVQAYDRAGLYKDLVIVGQTVTLQQGATPRLTIQADGMIRLGASTQLIFGTGATLYGYGADGLGTQLLATQGLTVTPGMTYLAGLTVNGGTTLNGTLTVTGGTTAVASMAVAGTLTVGQSQSVGLDLTVGRNFGVTGSATIAGTLTVNGSMGTQGNLNVNGGIVYFEASNQVMIRWVPGGGRLEVPYGNGLWATRLDAAGLVNAPDVYASRHRVSGSNTYLTAVSGECVAFLNVTPGSAIAQVAVNEANGHSKLFWVNGAAGGTTGWQQESTRTSKSSIAPLDTAAAVAMVTSGDIQAYRYLHRDDIPEIGFLAEEWVTPLPEAVTYDGEALSGLTYGMITPVLYAALKDALARISALEAAQTPS